MDHLPPIFYRTAPYPAIEYLDDHEYDGSSFLTYPKRRGIDIDDVLYRQGYYSHFFAVVQTWLYFGTLHEIFGTLSGFTSKEFVEHRHGRKFITAARLDHWITELLQNTVSEKGPARVARELHRIDASLNQLRDMIERLSESSVSWVSDHNYLPFCVLGATIDCALTYTLEHSSNNRQWGLRHLAIQQMKQANWCPSNVHSMNINCSEITMFYLSHLRRDLEKQKHWGCDKFVCNADQVKDKTNVTKHVSRGCDCKQEGPIMREIEKILDAGHIPAIKLTPIGTRDNPISVSMSVIDTDEEPEGIRAISHVWSQGLGNKQANKLPQCQLLNLYNIVKTFESSDLTAGYIAKKEKACKEKNSDPAKSVTRKLASKSVLGAQKLALKTCNFAWRTWSSNSVNIWIDTLCVPLEQPGKNHKQLALQRMNEVYKRAQTVTVIDTELAKYSGNSTETTEEEILARIALSAWMRRAWTYAEFALASSQPAFYFRGELIDFGKVFAPQMFKLFPIAGEPAVGANLFAITPIQFRSDLEVQGESDELTWGIPHAFDGIMNKVYEEIGKIPVDQWTSWRSLLLGAKAFVKPVLQRLLSETQPLVFSLQEFIGQEMRDRFDSAKGVQMWRLLPVLDLLQEDVRRLIDGVLGRSVRHSHRVQIVWNELARRATTRLEDKITIFALACGADSETLKMMLALPKERQTDRMAVWLAKQTEIPAGLLFVKGPRLTHETLGWLPLAPYNSQIESDEPIKRRGYDTADLAAVEIRKRRGQDPSDESELEIHRPGFVIEDDAFRQDMTAEHQFTFGAKSGQFFRLEKIEWTNTSYLRGANAGSPCLLGVIISAYPSATGKPAALVALNEAGRVLEGKFVGTADVFAQSVLTNGYHRTFFQAEERSADQWWIIG